MAGFPLETKRLPHRLLPPATSEIGAAGSGPVNWLLRTKKVCRAVRPLSEGIGPVNWLVLTLKPCKAVNPLSEGIDPVNWLL